MLPLNFTAAWFENKPLFVTVIVLVVLGISLVIFFAIGLVLWQVLLKLEKKTENTFEKILPFEEKRKAVLTECLQVIDTEKLHAKKEFVTAFKEGFTKVNAPTLLERRSAKDSMDFAQLYVGKVFDTYGKSAKDKELKQKIEKIKIESDKAYLEYGKIAASYNSILSIFPVRVLNRFHKKNRKEKAFLF